MRPEGKRTLSLKEKNQQKLSGILVESHRSRGGLLPMLTDRVVLPACAVLVLTAAAGAFAWQQESVPQPQSPVDFTRDIEPVFSKSCNSCHGAKTQMGSLALVSSKLAMTGGVSGKVIVPGDAANSTLYQRVAGIGDQARMPMGGKPLPPAQVDLIRRWIAEGAKWPDAAGEQTIQVKKHWAFTAPVRPALPDAKGTWTKNAIDSFILARLQSEGLQPSAVTDKVTQLRRASLDVTGLPPTIEEVDAYLADKRPDAWRRQVDRLLASPHYGERWARQWLDAARYADSDGFEKDKSRQVWFYRDWVINSFNRDLPYDRFIVEQIAGDLLPDKTQDSIVATGFLRNSMINEEGGIDPEQFRMEAMFDRIEAIGKGVLGLTIQCAQCHNHKFDPLTQEEYYRIFAFLNNTHESNVAVYTPEEQRKRQDLMYRIAAMESKLPTDTVPDTVTWTVLQPEADDISTGGQKYLNMPDSSMLAAGYAPTKHRVKLTVKTTLSDIRAFRLELLNDPNLPLGGPGRSTKGTGALTEFEVEAAPAAAPDKPVKVKIARAEADLNLPEQPLDAMFDDKSGKKRVTGPIAYAIDGKDETAWGHDGGPVLRNQPRTAIFFPETPVTNEGGTILTIYLSQKHGGWNSDDNQNHNLGRVRLSITTDAGAKVKPAPVNEELLAIWRQHPEGSSQLVLREREDKRATHILYRGDFLKPGKAVEPGVPAFLHSLPAGEQVDRLAFAKWLVDRRSPTTARTIVNRVWQAYFGQGLVSTSEDLGKQSEAPSHPELLDWLAVEFMDHGWSLKHLHRLILTSATYAQSSAVTPDLLTKDPYNRLLARGPRLRVEAETVRDLALAASGLLTPAIGGPSVYPPAPDFLFQPPVSYGPKNWYEEKGANRYRRALYTFRFRSVPYPMLQTFDAPNGDTSCVRRSRSNTPLQALVTLNEPLFLETARALAVRTLQQGGATDAQKLTYAFRRVLARQPAPAERDELLSFLAKQKTRLADGWLSARNLLGTDADKLPEGVTPVQAAAWTAVTRTIFNLDEAITKE